MPRCVPLALGTPSILTVGLLIAAIGGCTEDSASGPAASGGSTFEAIVSRPTGIANLRFTVQTSGFVPSAPGIEMSNGAATVAASGTYREAGLTKTLTGTWETGENQLSLTGAGIVVTGGYNVAQGYASGAVTRTGEPQSPWRGIVNLGTISVHCGTWGDYAVGMVITGAELMGYGEGDIFFPGIVSGSNITFGFAGEPIGTATKSGSNITGTLDGTAITAGAC